MITQIQSEIVYERCGHAQIPFRNVSTRFQMYHYGASFTHEVLNQVSSVLEPDDALSYTTLGARVNRNED